MAFITILELIDMAITILAVGFIFSGMFPKRQRPERLEDMYKPKRMIDWEDMKFAMMVAGPALILHELSHKIVAMGFGMQATYQAAYGWLGLGVLLKVVNFPFIVIVPAFVNIVGNGTPLQFALIAGAGPFMNMVLWLVFSFVLKRVKLSGTNYELAFFGREINKFLFIFNMIPIPGFDGFKFFTGLLQVAGIKLF